MVTKLVIVLSFLGFVCVFYVSPATWWEVISGFFRFGTLPEGEFNWATLAAFSAVAGAAGLTNSAFSSYARDKGWGMGAKTGAIPSAIGGRTVKLSHTGKVFEVTAESLPLWRRWLQVIERDQFWLWLPGCLLGMALPAMFSLEFVRGVKNVDGNAVAAMTADALARSHGQVFWFLTLLCGFLIMAPTQVSQLGSIARRWTDIIWIGARRTHSMETHKVKIVYYTILAFTSSGASLRCASRPIRSCSPSPPASCGTSRLASRRRTRSAVAPIVAARIAAGLVAQLGLVACATFYFGISGLGFVQQWPKVVAWLGSLW